MAPEINVLTPPIIPSRASRWPLDIESILVVCLFCAPLFVGLGRWDLHNDESIYSYAVDRILETGEWLTPRSIPSDGPFLEKPPLTCWLVAGAIRAHLLPHNEYGLRFFDALFGAVAFVYVFRLGRWLAGPGCGFVATLVLFTIDALLFDHGLRSNNMDAALFLSYCAGIYHFARWAEDPPSRRRSMHAIAVAAYFVLGFMTKFVAALFLPLVCVVALVLRSDGLRRLRADWREWVAPAALGLAVTAPWFIYATIQHGDALWREMVGVHVYDRFTRALDPRHVEPWHFYYTRTWDELTFAGSGLISVLGIAMLTVKAWLGRPWLARLLFLWCAVPFVLISVGSSKVSHYADPFLPPLALSAGWVAVRLFRAADRGVEMTAHLVRPRLRRVLARGRSLNAAGRIEHLIRRVQIPTAVRQVLLAAALLLLGVAVWTEATGQIRWQIGDLIVRNSSPVRPVAMAVILLCIAGARAIRWTAAAAAVAVLLPVLTYPLQAEHLLSVGSPLQELRDCARSMPASQRETRVYLPNSQLLNHAFYYYPRQIGPWLETRRLDQRDLQRRLLSPGHQTLVIIARRDFERFLLETGGDEAPGFALSSDVILLTPGPFAACGEAALAAGGTKIGRAHPTRTRH